MFIPYSPISIVANTMPRRFYISMIGTIFKIMEWLLTLPEDTTIEANVWKPKRTLTQNNYFHALVGKIAAAMRLSNTEVKNRLVADYGVYEDEPPIALRCDVKWERLESVHLKPTYDFVVIEGEDYQLYQVMKHTSDLTTKEFNKLVDGTIEEAKQLDIETWPPYKLEAIRRREEKNERRMESSSGA